MTLSQIANQRLQHQQLLSPTFTDVTQVVSWLGAVQAQEYALTQWSISMRAVDLTQEAIEAAFAQGSLLRTHLLRPTWHLVTAQDIGWLLQLTATRVQAVNAYMYRKLELNEAIFNRCHQIMRKQLQNGNYLSRSQLNLAFSQEGIHAQGMRLSYIMMQAELAGVVCSGPRKGNQFTYALLEERVPAVPALPPEEALAQLARRYFLSRGPATLPDFATWSGLSLTQARQGISMVKSLFEQEKLANQTYYFSAPVALAQQAQRQPQAVYLLPVYDEFIMGYKHREAILQLLQSQQPSPVLPFDNTILMEGQVVGSWKRTVRKKAIDLAFAFLRPPSQEQYTCFQRAVHRLATFTGLPVQLQDR